MTTPTAQPTPARDDAFSPTLQKIAAASGLFAAILIVISAFGFSADGPDLADPAAKFKAYYAEEADKLQAGALVLTFVAIEILWFTGFLSGQLSRIETARRGFDRVSRPILPAGALVAAGLVLVAVMDAVITGLPTDTGADIYRALSHISGAAFMLVAVGAIVLMTATSLAILALGGAPKWLAWVGFVGALGYFLTTFIILDPTNDDSAVGIGFPVGFLALVIWLTGLSVTFLRQVGRPDAVGRTDTV